MEGRPPASLEFGRALKAGWIVYTCCNGQKGKWTWSDWRRRKWASWHGARELAPFGWPSFTSGNKNEGSWQLGNADLSLQLLQRLWFGFLSWLLSTAAWRELRTNCGVNGRCLFMSELVWKLCYGNDRFEPCAL